MTLSAIASKTGLPKKPPSESLARLRTAARTLFASQGYQDTRPQDIAREAGVANGTFYLHFKDKQAAFLDFAQQAQQELAECLLLALEDERDVRKRWHIIVRTLVTFAVAYPGVLNAAFMDPILIAPDKDEAWLLYEALDKFVAFGQGSEDKLAPNLDQGLLSHSICGFLGHAMTYANHHSSDFEIDLFADQISRFITQGLGVPE